MEIFEIKRWETSSQTLFVKAETAEQAINYVETTSEDLHWRENQDTEFSHEVARTVTPSQIKGKYVELLNGDSARAEELPA